MSFDKIGIYTKNNQEFTFNFKTDLNMVNKLNFVNTVTTYLVSDNYNYLAKDLFFDFEIIYLFTDYDVSYIKESKDSISDIETLLDETDIVKVVKANMRDGLLEELYRAVNINLEYKTGIHNDVLRNALTEIITTIKEKIDTVDIESIMEFINLFKEHSDDFTPEAILDAFGKTDTFIKHNREVDEIRKEKINQTLQEIKKNSKLKVLNNT